jgi:hypothetical protein
VRVFSDVLNRPEPYDSDSSDADLQVLSTYTGCVKSACNLKEATYKIPLPITNTSSPTFSVMNGPLPLYY